MLAMQDRPTPVPAGDEEDDCETTLWQGSPLVNGGAGAPALASTPAAVAQEQTALTAPPTRHTISDPLRSRWGRFKAAVGRFGDALACAFFGTEPPLSSRLPPLPAPPRSSEGTLPSARPVADDQHGEAMLGDILRVPVTHQRAAIEVARWAIAARKSGERNYADFIVHFTLSRLRPGRDERIVISRLREILCYVPYESVILPALIRLEAVGVIVLVVRPSSDPMAAIQREGITHVELRARI